MATVSTSSPAIDGNLAPKVEFHRAGLALQKVVLLRPCGARQDAIFQQIIIRHRVRRTRWLRRRPSPPA